MKYRAMALALLLAVVGSPAQAETARDILMNAAYTSPDKRSALVRVDQAIKSADAAIERNPRDQNARLQHALAVSYRGKLNRSRSDLITARRAFEAVAAAEPRNAEAQMAIAGWHLGAVIELGPLVARTMLGARTATGQAALARSLELGSDRASIPLLAGLHRIQLDPKDIAGARRLAEIAAAADVSSPFERLMQKQATIFLGTLRKGNGKAAAATAKLLLPFGRIR